MKTAAKGKRRYAVIGAGAVGGYYGGLLQRAGFEVHFLFHTDAEHVRRHGLRVDSKNGDFILPRVHAHDRPETVPPCDVTFVALKTTSNERLPELIQGACSGGGVVLMMQNGLGVEEVAAATVGAERVLGGLTFLCSNKVGPGHIRHLDYGEVTLGAYGAEYQTAGITPAVRAVASDLQAAGVVVRVVADLMAARWRKLVWNIPFNGLSVVLNALTSDLVRDPETRALAVALMREVRAAAAAWERDIEEGFLDRMLRDTEVMTPYATSMKLDHEFGRPMEIEAIYRAPARAARQKGVDMPQTGLLAGELGFLDRSARRTRFG